MKPLAGLLVEYLVIGAVALIWIVPLFIDSSAYSQLTASKEVGSGIIALVLPSVYVVGMVCDFWGYKLLKLGILGKYGKTGIEKEVWGDMDPESQNIHIYAVCYEPQLAEEIEARSSRDRIARGALVASFPVVLFPPVSLPFYLHYVLSIALIISLFMLWYRYQILSAKYEKKALAILQEKHNLSIEKNSAQQ